MDYDNSTDYIAHLTLVDIDELRQRKEYLSQIAFVLSARLADLTALLRFIGRKGM